MKYIVTCSSRSYVVVIFLCISFHARRTTAMPSKLQSQERHLFRASNESSTGKSSEEEGSRAIMRPETIDRAAFYFIFIISGTLMTLLCGYFFLVLALIIDSIAENEVGVADERVRRGNIPKIIFARVVKTDDKESEESSLDEELGTLTEEVASVHPVSSATSQPPVETNEQKSEKKEEENEKHTKVTKEDHLKWIKTIYFLLHISETMQVYLGKNMTSTKVSQSMPESRLAVYENRTFLK